MTINVNNTNSSQKTNHSFYVKKNKKTETPDCDERLIIRTEETFRFALNALQRSPNSPTFHNVHNQAKRTREVLVDGNGPDELITTLSSLQKLTDPNRPAGKDPETRGVFLQIKITELASNGLTQVRSYK